MKRAFSSLIVTCALLALVPPSTTQAQDKKTDPSGTWTWTTPGRNDRPDRKFSLNLKVAGEKVTGKISSPGRDGQARETEISEGKVKGDEISFNVKREFNGNTITQKYIGKVTGNSLKGEIETERNGEARSRDWEAKRATDKT